MAGGQVNADRVKETAAAPGTGTITLGGAVTGFQTFQSGGCTNGAKIYYGISDGATKWEVGLGTWSSGVPATLARTTVLASSNSGSLENFTLAVTVWADRPAKMDVLPTQQVLLSGTGATYTTPPQCRQLRVRMKAGGGGGGGGSVGGDGGDSIFNGIHAGGGLHDSTGQGGAGGSSSTGTANVRIAGAPGGVPHQYFTSPTSVGAGGGNGGGEGGGLGGNQTTGNAAVANTGGGGGAGGNPGGSVDALSVFGGGGEGEYVELLLSDPAATYTFTVGPGGTAGASGGGTSGGGAGGDGYIIVDEIYGS